MGKIYAQYGEAIITVSAGEILTVASDAAVKIYEETTFTNHPDIWSLTATTTAGVEYVSDAFTVTKRVKIEGGVAPVDYSAGTPTTVGATNGATVSSDEYIATGIRKTVITLANTPVSIADDAGVAQYGGTGKIYDLPDGLVTVLGCLVDGDLTLGTTGTITATFAGGVALGTAAATTGATLTGTEADIMAEVDVAAATASVATIAGPSVGTTLLNGTGTAKDVYLNFVIDDDATHTAGTGDFNGTVTIIWVNVGDLA